MNLDGSPIILVEQDINTLETELGTRRFTAEQISEFYDEMTEEAEEILRKYFPKSD